jgi:NTE family protein
LSSRAVVFAGGGVAGISWMLGLVEGFAQAGLNLADADLISGTSAGACVATNLATGAVPEACARQRRESAEIVVPFDIDEFLATVARHKREAPDEAAALVRIAAMEPIGPPISEAERGAVIEARLPVHEWPDRPLQVVCVDAESGELLALGRDSGFSLVAAVASSCALPGIWPPRLVNGRRYVDGGIRSLSNIDLAAGHDRVLVVVPTALSDSVRERHAEEIAALGGAATHLIAADQASLDALGSNPLDPDHREPALEAGFTQAPRELPALASFWA